jgi:hypothetical protein
VTVPSGRSSAAPVDLGELIRSGIAAARANPALVTARWAGELAVAALVVLGTLAPPVALFGIGFAARFAPLGAGFRARDADALAVAVLDLWDAVGAAPGRLGAGLAALVALWTLAMFVYCWLQGGCYGVLVAADRAAAPAGGAGARALPGPAFSVALFAAAGRRLLWPYFWFVNLYATALLLVVLLALLPLALLPPPPAGEPPLLALAVALATLPVAALAAAALALWYALGRAELARAGASVAAASRRALSALRRRPGPIVAVSLLAAGAALAVAGAVAPLGAVLPKLPKPAALAGGLLLTAVQSLAAAAAGTAYAGALVRLMRAEFPAAAGEGAP